MHVGRHEIPIILADGIREGRFVRRRGSWPLRAEFDSFGNTLETELSEVLGDVAAMQAATEDLILHFREDGTYGTDDRSFSGPGWVPDIVDFSSLVCFAYSGDAAPFCLDYREGGPSVLWWDDCYWRLVSPNAEAFLALFRLEGGEAAP